MRNERVCKKNKVIFFIKLYMNIVVLVGGVDNGDEKRYFPYMELSTMIWPDTPHIGGMRSPPWLADSCG